MNDFLDPGAPTDVCQKCHAPYTFRTDASGTRVREMCKNCHPSAHLPVASPVAGWEWMPKFIAFTGLAQSGKSTCSNWLKEKFGFATLSFAAPLKRMLATLTPCHDKEATPYVLCGRTVRHAMQTLGTEWGRDLIGQDIWLRAARMEFERIKLTGAFGISCDDVRFDNEAALVREMGGIVIALERPGSERMGHASESGVSPSLVNARLSAGDVKSLIDGLDSFLARA